MKIISILRGLSTDSADRERKALWLCDPLAHPALEAMSERELADLPLAHSMRRSAAADVRCR